MKPCYNGFFTSAQQRGSKLAAPVTVHGAKKESPEMSPLGLTLELDILCPFGILRAFTMPSSFQGRAKHPANPNYWFQHTRLPLPYCSVHALLRCTACCGFCILQGNAMPSSGP